MLASGSTFCSPWHRQFSLQSLIFLPTPFIIYFAIRCIWCRYLSAALSSQKQNWCIASQYVQNACCIQPSPLFKCAGTPRSVDFLKQSCKFRSDVTSPASESPVVQVGGWTQRPSPKTRQIFTNLHVLTYQKA